MASKRKVEPGSLWASDIDGMFVALRLRKPIRMRRYTIDGEDVMVQMVKAKFVDKPSDSSPNDFVCLFFTADCKQILCKHDVLKQNPFRCIA